MSRLKWQVFMEIASRHHFVGYVNIPRRMWSVSLNKLTHTISFFFKEWGLETFSFILLYYWIESNHNIHVMTVTILRKNSLYTFQLLLLFDSTNYLTKLFVLTTIRRTQSLSRFLVTRVKILKRKEILIDITVHTCNPSTREEKVWGW